MQRSVIEAHAILHQASREKDEDGFIVATLDDYAKVHELVGDLVAEELEASVPPIVRETVEKLRELYSDLENKSDGVSAEKLRQELELDKNATARRLRMAIGRGYVRNLEEKKGKAGRYVPGDPLPDDVVVLPTPEDVAAVFKRTTVPSDFSNEDTSKHTSAASKEEREQKVSEDLSPNVESLGTVVHPTPPKVDGDRRLTEEEAQKVQRLISEGMLPRLAREAVLKRPERGA